MDAGDDGLGRNGCFMWHGELLDIVQYTDDGQDLHVRVHTTGNLCAILFLFLFFFLGK